MDNQYKGLMKEKNGKQFPIGTIVYYGPDDKLTTKIVASVFKGEDIPPITRKWMGDGVVKDPQVIAELGRFFKDNGVQRVVMTGSNAGCPHEEGVDYPIGETCPKCTYWMDQKD
jgi:hypothetical protein